MSVARSLSGFAFDCRRSSEIDLQCRGSLGRRLALRSPCRPAAKVENFAIWTRRALYQRFFFKKVGTPPYIGCSGMIQRDYLIVGGGVGGASVCDSLRQYDTKGSVTLVSNEPYLPYQRPPLSKSFLKDASVTFDKVIEKSEDWYKKRGIEVRLGTYVREFNIERRLAVLENGQTIEFRKACLATGSR